MLRTDLWARDIYNVRNQSQQIVLHPDAHYRVERTLQEMIEVFFRGEDMAQSRLKALLALLLCEMTLQYRSTVNSLAVKKKCGLDLQRIIEHLS